MAKRAERDGGKGFFGRIPLKYPVIGLFLLLVVLLGATLVPEEKVPPSLDKVHAFLLTWRNKAIRASELPISRYEDSYVLENPRTDPIRIYFAPSPNIIPALCSCIDSAVRTVEVCAYDLRSEEVAQALVRARKRGISVRVVTDTDNFKNPAVSFLLKYGVPVVSDHRPSYMHHKFAVVDSRYVWTGSFNFTPNGSLKNDNNAIWIESPGIAAGYRAKFEEYWNGRFSRSARPVRVPDSAFIGNIPAGAVFSPSDHVRATLLLELSRARRTVDIMAYSFTGSDLATELRDLVKRGVKVRCLFDAGQAANKASRDGYLKLVGAEVHLSPNRSGKMHHKVIIIDNRTVITGSYNYSANAEYRNDENILIVRSPAIAELYTKEMNRCIRGTKGY